MATREEIIQTIEDYCWWLDTEEITREELRRDIMEDLIPKLQELGVVIKVGKKINGNLINELYDAMGVIEGADCKLLVKQALDKAGLLAVEPLIKE